MAFSKLETALYNAGLFRNQIRQRRRERHERDLDIAAAIRHRPNKLFFPRRKSGSPWTEYEFSYPEEVFSQWLALYEIKRPIIDDYHKATAIATEREIGFEDVIHGILDLINVIVDRKISTIFWMDKSARPVQRLTRAVWHELFNRDPDRPGHRLTVTDPRYYPFPESRFLDIGQFDDGPGKSIRRTTINMDAVGPLRDRFTNIAPHGNILILDEASRTGETLNGAEMLINGMYPQAQITKHVAFNFGVKFWHKNPEFAGVADGPNNSFDPIIAPYFTQRLTEYAPRLPAPPEFNPYGIRMLTVDDRLAFSQLMHAMVPVIVANAVSVVPKGSVQIPTRTSSGY